MESKLLKDIAEFLQVKPGVIEEEFGKKEETEPEFGELNPNQEVLSDWKPSIGRGYDPRDYMQSYYESLKKEGLY
jgi:hypothetical protein